MLEEDFGRFVGQSVGLSDRIVAAIISEKSWLCATEENPSVCQKQERAGIIDHDRFFGISEVHAILRNSAINLLRISQSQGTRWSSWDDSTWN